MSEPKNEPTRADLEKLFNDVADYLHTKIIADPRYRTDMTENEYLALCETIIHEDEEREVKLVREVERIGLVPALQVQERGRD